MGNPGFENEFSHIDLHVTSDRRLVIKIRNVRVLTQVTVNLYYVTHFIIPANLAS